MRSFSRALLLTSLIISEGFAERLWLLSLVLIMVVFNNNYDG